MDDSDGRIVMPKDDELITISLGWSGGSVAEVFRGKVNDIKSSGGRSGRMLAIGCSGMGTKSKTKQISNKHFDESSLGDIMKAVAQGAGITEMLVDAELAATQLPYFAQIEESFVHFGQRVADMFGGTFKVMGDKAVMVKRGAGKSVSGRPLKTITGAWGENLSTWDIAPITGRPRHKDVQAKWYDRKKAQWSVEAFPTTDTDAIATAKVRFPPSSQLEAKASASSGASAADRGKGGGTVVIDGEPDAVPEAPFILSGTRPGIDGNYLIDSVTHNFGRSAGFMTSLSLRRPKVAKDNR